MHFQALFILCCLTFHKIDGASIWSFSNMLKDISYGLEEDPVENCPQNSRCLRSAECPQQNRTLKTQKPCSDRFGEPWICCSNLTLEFSSTSGSNLNEPLPRTRPVTSSNHSSVPITDRDAYFTEDNTTVIEDEGDEPSPAEYRRHFHGYGPPYRRRDPYYNPSRDYGWGDYEWSEPSGRGRNRHDHEDGYGVLPKASSSPDVVFWDGKSTVRPQAKTTKTVWGVTKWDKRKHTSTQSTTARPGNHPAWHTHHQTSSTSKTMSRGNRVPTQPSRTTKYLALSTTRRKPWGSFLTTQPSTRGGTTARGYSSSSSTTTRTPYGRTAVPTRRQSSTTERTGESPSMRWPTSSLRPGRYSTTRTSTTSTTPLPDVNLNLCGLRVTSRRGRNAKMEFHPDAVPIHSETKNDQKSRAPFQRIVGGREAEPFSWPWVAALYRVAASGGNRFLSAGSLINENYVLTAAHVFTPDDLKTSRYVVMLGTHTAKEAVAEYAVSSVLVHPRYQPRFYDHDIALLRLARPVSFSSYVMPVCLPSPNMPLMRDEDIEGKQATVMGWGDESFGGITSRVLMEATFPIVPRKTCNASYTRVASNRFPHGITDKMLCAGDPKGGKDACQGDSGGPLTTIENGRFTQVGIVSFGFKCGDKEYPGVYTKVAPYLSWIAENTHTHDYDY